MSLLRNTTGTVLSGTAQALSVTSKLLEATARALRPEGRRADQAPEEAPARAATPGRVRPGPSDEPAQTPVLDETPHVRTSESHIEELAAKPASQVIAAVSGMSTDELSWLTEYEMQHRNRRTVLAAIERALTPANGGTTSRPPSSAGDREIVLPEAGGMPTSGKLQQP